MLIKLYNPAKGPMRLAIFMSGSGYPHVGDEELARVFPIYGYARECQDRLKIHGDWIEFPNAIVNISSGSYEKDREGKLYFEGNPIPEGVVREK